LGSKEKELRRLKQENREFKASLDYIVSSNAVSKQQQKTHLNHFLLSLVIMCYDLHMGSVPLKAMC
jgi:hypothetical protein